MNGRVAWRMLRTTSREEWREFFRSSYGRRAIGLVLGYLATVVVGELVYFGMLWLVGFWTTPGGWLSALLLVAAVVVSMPVLWFGIRLTDRVAPRVDQGPN